MKTIFFDVDKITRDYLEKQQICTGDTVLLPESMENISQQQYEQIKDAEIIYRIILHFQLSNEVFKSNFVISCINYNSKIIFFFILRISFFYFKRSVIKISECQCHKIKRIYCNINI